MAYLTAVFTASDKSYNVHCIREFTPEQFADHERVLADFVRLRQRFSLLHIVELNFAALMSFIHELESSQNPDKNRALVQANRHFMNYLSSSYALWQHLRTSLIRDFGRRSEQVLRFMKYIQLLEDNRFEYAFCQDFRNFVQHCGFPVGGMNLRHDRAGRVATVKYSKAALLTEYNGWEKSHLRGRPETDFDLLAIIKQHNRMVIQGFSVVIQAVYASNLDRIESYFLSLHKEAKRVHENAVAKVVLALPSSPEEGTITFEDIPANPLAELGLSRKHAKS
ncbi:MAG: hypothetical protein ABSF95_17515 [Verrucomicrobiota bacterium]|jgi:hypothetical protein